MHMYFYHVPYISICTKYFTRAVDYSNGQERLCPVDCTSQEAYGSFKGNSDAAFPLPDGFRS